MDPIVALQHCGGVASWARLRALGLTPYALRIAERGGGVVRIRHGVHGLPDAEPGLLAAVRIRGILSCTSAARFHDLPIMSTRPDRPHVTVPRSRGRARAANATVHRRELVPDDHDESCTSPLRTVLDCARELPFPAGVVLCDAALHRGLQPAELDTAAMHARGPGAQQLRRVVAAADGRAESPIETLLRLVAGSLGDLALQVAILGVGRVDMVLDGLLVLEADGFAHHKDRDTYRNDRRRGMRRPPAGSRCCVSPTRTSSTARTPSGRPSWRRFAGVRAADPPECTPWASRGALRSPRCV
ncbi:MAG: hypothetical protein H0T85_11060 [Geodermatophilaceae bacterium]|nr:hypothetical protein [Geodermatophilaceae bacterium]